MIFNLFRKKKIDYLNEFLVQPDVKDNFCKPSEEDTRDYYVRGTGDEPYTMVDLRSQCPPIRNQRTLGSCASHAAITCYEFELMKKKKYVEMSELYHYWQARKAMGQENQNVGMTLRHACDTLKKKGLSFECYWPYNLAKAYEKPSIQNYWVNALLNRIPNLNVDSYYLVHTIDDVKHWLSQDVIIIAGINMFPAFNNAWKKDRITPKDLVGVNLNTYGGHAINIVGFNDEEKTLLIRNSWGTKWGINGYIWIDYDVWERICFEMRAIKV